jgi:hypothetical protein
MDLIFVTKKNQAITMISYLQEFIDEIPDFMGYCVSMPAVNYPFDVSKDAKLMSPKTAVLLHFVELEVLWEAF